MDTDFKKIFKYPFNTYILYVGTLWLLFFGFVFGKSADSTFHIVLTIIIGIITVTITFLATKIINRYLVNIKRLKSLIQEISITEGYDNINLDLFNYRIEEIYYNILALYNERVKAINSTNQKNEESIAIEKIKLRSKRILTNNINHEIKTPIGILQGYIETLLRHPDISPQLREKFLGKCFDNIRRIDNLMSNISIITRLEDGSEAIKLDRVLLNSIITNAVEEMSIFLAKDNITFKANIPSDTYVLTSESVFHALFSNLIKNAINYAKCSEITFESLDEENGFYIFEFYDNGIGVDEEHFEHLFDRFFRIDKNNSTKIIGSGLGLPIVQSIVHLHGGTIEAKNHPNGGLCFIFSIPKA